MLILFHVQQSTTTPHSVKGLDNKKSRVILPPMTDKTLTDKNGKTIQAGTIVHYGDGWVRVTSVSKGKQTVNLTSVFGSKPFTKSVPLSEVYEDDDRWFKHWQQSETYQCM